MAQPNEQWHVFVLKYLIYGQFIVVVIITIATYLSWGKIIKCLNDWFNLGYLDTSVLQFVAINGKNALTS